MSSASASPNKREIELSDISQELEAVRAMNKSLREYLQQLRRFKTDLVNMKENYKELENINSQYVDLIRKK